MSWSPPEAVAEADALESEWSPPEAQGWTPPEAAQPQPLTSEQITTLGAQIEQDTAQRAAISRGMESGTEFLSEVANDPAGAAKAIPEIVTGALTSPGRLAYDAAADAVSAIAGDPQYGGNLRAGMTGQTKPVDRFLGQVAQTNPKLATAGFIGRDLAGMAPLAAVGMLPARVAQLVTAGFTVDMIRHAPALFEEYANEINKPEAERDNGKISELESGIAQTFVFAPLAGAHATRGVPEQFRVAFDNARRLTPDAPVGRASPRAVMPAEEGAPVPEWAPPETISPIARQSDVARSAEAEATAGKTLSPTPETTPILKTAEPSRPADTTQAASRPGVGEISVSADAPTPETAAAASSEAAAVNVAPIVISNPGKPRLTEADLKPDVRADLRAEGVTPENVEALLNGKKTAQQVVDEQLGIKKSGGSIDADTILVLENEDGSRSIGFTPEAGPASTSPVNVGQMSHGDAIAMARQQGVERIQEIFSRYPKAGASPGLPPAPKPAEAGPTPGIGSKSKAPAKGGDVTNQQQSTAPPAGPSNTPQAPAPVKRVASGLRARKVFDRETELQGPDILSFIQEFGGMMSMTEARRSRGPDWWKLNRSLYDDAAPLQRPQHNVIYGGKSFPDQIAQAAYEAKVLKSPDVNELWIAIRNASNRRSKAFSNTRAEERLVQEQEAWSKATAQGEMRVTPEDLQPGDTFEVNGERFTVERFDANTGEVIIKDGQKFGRQTIAPGKSIWVENASDAIIERIAENPAEAPAVPKLRAGEKGTGDLLQGDDAPFNLAGEKGIDADRITRARAEAEANAKAAAEFAAKNQTDMWGTSGMGFPMAAPVPPTPAPAAVPGVTMIQHGRLPVTLDRTAPGSVSVPQIMDSMKRVLNVAGSQAGDIRTGRFLQRALGIWKPHEEIIRLESADSIPTATHEIGHGLQQMIYGTAKASGLKFLGPAIRRELIGMGKALYGSRKPAAGYTGEGFAEFARYWLTTENAATVAPNMTRFFETVFLPKHPEVANAMREARDLVSIWRAQGSVERAKRQVMREPGAFKRMAESLAQLVGYQSQFESAAPIEAVSKAAARKLGRPLPPSEDPFKLFSWKRGSAGATVERMATEHMVDVWGNPVGPSLAEALAPVKGRRNEFLLYLFAQAAEMRWRQGKNPGISLEDAQHIKALYDSPEFALAAQKYRAWNDQLLDYAVQADPAMADAVAAMRGANDFYAPLARMIDPAKAKAAAAAAQSNSMQRMFGSGLPVKDIFDQTFINAARLVNRANRALVMRSVIKLARLPGLGHIVEHVPRDRVRESVNVEQIRKQLDDMGVDTTMIPPDQMLQYYSFADRPKGIDPIVAVKDAAGQTQWYQVDPRLYDTLESLQTYSLKQALPGIPYLGAALDLLLGAPARMFRLGTTGLRPAFSLVTNPARDVATLLAQTSSNPAKVAAMYPAALAEAIRGGPYKSAFFDLGAHLGQPLGLDIGHTQRVSKELFHGRIMRVVRNPVDHLRELLSITESAPRIAELRAVADDIGWRPGTPMTPNQAVQLALAAKRVTVDFSAAGDVSRILNQSIPFYNPALQGMRSFARAFKNNPAKATLVGLTLFTGPALALWWKNKDEEWYKALPWRERYLYSNFDDGKNVWRIPRPFEWGNAFMVVPEAILDSWYRQDPEAARKAVGHIFESTNPIDLPVIAKIAKEQWSNRIEFWDRPIVPRGEDDLPPSEQVGPYTSRLAIGINKAFPDLSPRRVDAAIRGYFGGLGTDMMDLLGLGATRQDRQWEGSDFPVFGTLVRRGGEFNAQNQHINDFWELYLPSRARMAGFNYARSQAEQGLRRPETVKAPSAGDYITAQIGEEAGRSTRLLLQMAARTKDTRARAELYRQAGEIARDATVAMKNAQNPASK